jgi:outer membrane biosynthesis protein TonB
VTDAEGYPLIGANIQAPGTSRGAVSDLDGFFQLAVDSSQQFLQVAYLGYEAQQAAIPAEGMLRIVMEEDGEALEEVVVTGYARQANEEDDATYLPLNARPVNGFQDLRDYLALRVPPGLARGKVRLQFTVYPDGSLGDFSVLRSTNPDLNALAIRLLAEGPAWEVVGDQQEPVTRRFTVRFR